MRIRKEYNIEVRWVAYPLNPYLPNQQGMILGFAPDAAYDPETITQKTTKTRLAQELTKWAETKGKGDAFRYGLFDALYVQGKDLTDNGMLYSLAETVGLSSADARETIQSGTYKDTIDSEWVYTLTIDPQYVPSVLLNGELLVNPQEYKLLEDLLERHRIKRYD